jgi:pimeloyl-ACP methyl ester carboxylesterase
MLPITLRAPRRAHVAALIVCCALGALAFLPALARAQAGAPSPTIVLVHGAWDKPAGWNGVAARLRAAGYPVAVPDNPLRSLSGDAAAIARFLHGVAGPIVLVGHSYGGMVITNAALNNPRVKALVYIAAFAPDQGETALGLLARSPGSLLPLALLPAPFIGPDHRLGVDTTINPLLFPTVFAQDAPPRVARQMAVTQHPATLASGAGKSGIPAWRTIPSWYMVAHNDRIIPPAVERFMAKRAHAITVEIASSHAAPIAHPTEVTDLILTAARAAR